MSKSYVYIIGCCPPKSRVRGPIKVGVSDNPWCRVRDMQTGSPEFLSLFNTVTCPSRREAFELEHTFHVDNAESKIHGEWFDMSPSEALSFIISYVDINLWSDLSDVPLFLHAARESRGIHRAIRNVEWYERVCAA